MACSTQLSKSFRPRCLGVPILGKVGSQCLTTAYRPQGSGGPYSVKYSPHRAILDVTRTGPDCQGGPQRILDSNLACPELFQKHPQAKLVRASSPYFPFLTPSSVHPLSVSSARRLWMSPRGRATIAVDGFMNYFMSGHSLPHGVSPRPGDS